MKLYLDGNKLNEIALENRDKYASAKPFPHIVLDDVFPEEALDGVLQAFPKTNSAVWKEYGNYHEKKLETQGEEKVSAFTSLLLYQFNSAPFLQFLETLTGIEKIIPDAYFYGGGLHQIPPGGKLGIHADFSRHGTYPLDRRLNVLVYLNKDWKEEYGGHLELWETDMSRCVQKILPVFNRMVVFSITDWAYHGHPEPLTCPDGMTRKSIALYYYTNGRPEGETKKDKASTLFMQRPGEVLPEGTVLARDGSYTGVKSGEENTSDGESKEKHERDIKWWIKKFTPPIVIDVAKSLRG